MSDPKQIGPFLSNLFPVVCDATEKYRGRKRKGADFEDEVSAKIYDVALELGFQPNTPRLTLQLPTRSDNKHQFDASFETKNTYYLVECKNTQTAAKDYVYYFNSKIQDYRQRNPNYGFKGIFLCAVQIPDSAWRYAIAYGLRLLDPESPPPEYMFENCDEDPFLADALERHIENIEEVSDYLWEDRPGIVTTLYDEYRYFVTRWRNSQIV